MLGRGEGEKGRRREDTPELELDAARSMDVGRIAAAVQQLQPHAPSHRLHVLQFSRSRRTDPPPSSRSPESSHRSLLLLLGFVVSPTSSASNVPPSSSHTTIFTLYYLAVSFSLLGRQGRPKAEES